MKSKSLVTFCFIIFQSASILSAFAQGTAFTYQGRLADGPNPANGFYDFIFLVYPDTNTAVPLVSGYPVTALPVSNGLFTATIDFGAGVFTGADRWLGINMRTNGAASYVTLNPRQKMTPAPYAILAATVASDGLAAGTYGNALALNNPANQLAGAFTGNGGGLTNLNAATIGGLGINNFWQTGGNAGTSPGANYIGTSDSTPLELRVNNQRALRLEPTTANDAPNFVGGQASNFVSPGVLGATIGGGGAFPGALNMIWAGANYATVAGGAGNQASGSQATIGGGNVNGASALVATVAGGRANWAMGTGSTVGGGYGSVVQTNSNEATIGGGNFNTILSNTPYATIGGGSSNTVFGTGGVVAGGLHNYVGSVPGGSVGGGIYNSASAYGVVAGGISNSCFDVGASTIGGGIYNSMDPGNMVNGTIAGGVGNFLQGPGGGQSIGGGASNFVHGSYGTVPGGTGNYASDYSFAAGANAIASYFGSYVWSDPQGSNFYATASFQYAIRALNGVVVAAGTNSTALELRTGGAIKVTGAGIGTGTPVFIHRATADNITANWTTIDNALCNGDPNAILIVTPNYNPGGSGGTYNNHSVGVFYNGSSRWAIFNQDQTAMSVNSAFNVLVVKP